MVDRHFYKPTANERVSSRIANLEDENARLKSELDAARVDLKHACKIAKEYIEYHAQAHPAYNGNRFDDQVWLAEKDPAP